MKEEVADLSMKGDMYKNMVKMKDRKISKGLKQI